LIAALPTVVLATASGRIRLRTGIVLLAVSGPLMGYVYGNPPLAGLVLVVTLLAVPLAGSLWGRRAARRALANVALGIGGLVVTGAYWIVPAVLSLGGVNSGQLSPVSAWAWSESRATLKNAFWLNTSWGWAFNYYYPYAPRYATQPLEFATMVLPAAAFSALVLAPRPATIGQPEPRVRPLRVAVPAASLALLLLFFSTGTRFPAGPVFDFVYRMPMGWLLREPGRFLIAGGLVYAILVAAAVSAAAEGRALATLRAGTAQRRATLIGAATAVGAMTVILMPAYPLVTGALVPGKRVVSTTGAVFPSNHVRFPRYWLAMADYLNHRAPPGSVLMLPPDDSIYMPFTWYYGADGFGAQLFDRNVVDPEPATYFTVNGQVSVASNLLGQSLLAGQWRQASLVAGALGTPLVLVRGDVDASFPGREIMSPAALAGALADDPDAHLLHRAGPLTLFELRHADLPRSPTIATSSSPAPDLRALSALPSGAAIVTSAPIAGVTALVQPSSLNRWEMRGNALVTTLVAPPGRRYSVVALPSGAGQTQIAGTQGTTSPSAPTFTANRLAGAGVRFQLSVPVGPNVVADPTFASGLWGPVGDCDDQGSRFHELLHAAVLPGAGPSGQPALQLDASADAACEAMPVNLPAGPALVDLWVRHVVGVSPRLCIWENALGECDPNLPELPSGHGWQHYQAVVSFPPAAGSAAVFLYAQAAATGERTVDEYADVSIRSLPTVDPPAVIVANPLRADPTGLHLEVAATYWSPNWVGPPGARHVPVDGVRNGWLLGSSQSPATPRYTEAAAIDFGLGVSSAASAVLVLLAAVLVYGARRSARRGSRVERESESLHRARGSPLADGTHR
jgi:hypothetical protein